jgi:2-keto-4-pentenoate hydratase
MNDLVNPLIKKGMTAQLATRRARIAAGEKPLGWKVGLGSPTMTVYKHR